MAPGRSFRRLAASSASNQLPVTPFSAHGQSASSSTKRGRGPTIGLGLEKMSRASVKLIIDVDVEKGRPTDSLQSSKLASEIGIISREFIQPTCKWKEMEPSALNTTFDRLEERFLMDVSEPHVRESVEAQLKARLRGRRHALHKKFLSFISETQARENPPDDVTREDWEKLCDMWKKDSWKAWSRANKENRKKVKTMNKLGSKSYVFAREQLRNKETKEEENPIEFYRHTYNKEGKGWQSKTAGSSYAAMLEIKAIPTANGATPLTSKDIVKLVLGKRSIFTRSHGDVNGSSSSKSRAETVALQNELEDCRKQVAAMSELVKEMAAQQKKCDAFISTMVSDNASGSPPNAPNASASFPPNAPNASADSPPNFPTTI